MVLDDLAITEAVVGKARGRRRLTRRRGHVELEFGDHRVALSDEVLDLKAALRQSGDQPRQHALEARPIDAAHARVDVVGREQLVDNLEVASFEHFGDEPADDCLLFAWISLVRLLAEPSRASEPGTKCITDGRLRSQVLTLRLAGHVVWKVVRLAVDTLRHDATASTRPRAGRASSRKCTAT